MGYIWLEDLVKYFMDFGQSTGNRMRWVSGIVVGLATVLLLALSYEWLTRFFQFGLSWDIFMWAYLIIGIGGCIFTSGALLLMWAISF